MAADVQKLRDRRAVEPTNFVRASAQHLRGFFAWWRGELYESIPQALRQWLDSNELSLVMIDTAGGVEIRRRVGQGWETIGQARNGSADPGRRRIRAGDFVPSENIAGASVAVRLARHHFLRRVINLPLAAAENLREVLSFEMDRYTPFKAEDVYFDFQLVGTNSRLKRISVDLTVIPRRLADDALSLAEALGLRPVYLGIACDPDSDEAYFDVLATHVHEARGTVWRNSMIVLTLVFVLLAAIALYLPLHEKQVLLAEREALLAIERAQASRAEKQKVRFENMLTVSRQITNQQRERPTATELLDEIAKFLPDDTWIHKLHIKQDSIDLSGYSKKPSALIGILEDSRFLTNVRLVGAVTPDPKFKLDAFNLTATVGR